MPRLFIAVWPPNEILDQLGALPRPDRPGVRWSTPDQWHVTLRFLGSVAEADAQAAFAALDGSSEVAELGPRVRRLGRRVIAAPITGLDDLAHHVRQGTASIGEPLDQRPFVGHITLARLRQAPHAGLTGHPIGGSWPVTEIALVASERLPAGSRYTTIGRRRLDRA